MLFDLNITFSTHRTCVRLKWSVVVLVQLEDLLVNFLISFLLVFEMKTALLQRLSTSHCLVSDHLICRSIAVEILQFNRPSARMQWVVIQQKCKNLGENMVYFTFILFHRITRIQRI